MVKSIFFLLKSSFVGNSLLLKWLPMEILGTAIDTTTRTSTKCAQIYHINHTTVSFTDLDQGSRFSLPKSMKHSVHVYQTQHYKAGVNRDSFTHWSRLKDKYCFGPKTKHIILACFSQPSIFKTKSCLLMGSVVFEGLYVMSAKNGNEKGKISYIDYISLVFSCHE